MYKDEKPAPDALYLTLKKMGLINSEILYIGDAFSDYETARSASVPFAYYCPDSEGKDSKIPEIVPTISSHKEIFKLLELNRF